MNAARLLGSFSLLVAMAFFAGCSDSQPALKVSSPGTVPNATTAPAAAGTSAEFLATGPIVVENQLDLQATREGIVSQIRADVGTRLRKGELLAQLDDRQITAQRDASAAKVKSVEADVQSWESDTRALQADLDRAEAMSQANLISKEGLEHARYKVQQGKFEVEREKQNLVSAQETLKSLNLELDKTRILAPFDGIVARRYIRQGQKVAPGDRLFWITAVAPLRLKFILQERFVGRLRAGELLRVTSPDGRQETHARVISVSPVVDPASGTIEVVAELVNPPSDLRPGMTATAHLPPPR